MQLPELLHQPSDARAVEALRRYYSREPYSNLAPFTGARFDAWDSTRSRAQDSDRFTADDLVAVSLLSVAVPAEAAVKLLDTDAAKFAKLLHELGNDRDLADETESWSDDWPGWQLWRELMDLPGVGATTASKLMSRKRPRLRPIYDSVVVRVIDSQNIWEPLRVLLTERPELHTHLLDLRAAADLPDAVSALRIFDVVTWMEGKYGADAVWSKV